MAGWKYLPPATINRQAHFMFTGIVEEAGVIEKIKPTAKSIQMTVRANVCGHGLLFLSFAPLKNPLSVL